MKQLKVRNSYALLRHGTAQLKAMPCGAYLSERRCIGMLCHLAAVSDHSTACPGNIVSACCLHCLWLCMYTYASYVLNHWKAANTLIVDLVEPFCSLHEMQPLFASSYLLPSVNTRKQHLLVVRMLTTGQERDGKQDECTVCMQVLKLTFKLAVKLLVQIDYGCKQGIRPQYTALTEACFVPCQPCKQCAF